MIGTEPFSLENEGNLREHLSIYHHRVDANVDAPDDGNDRSEDGEIKASILYVPKPFTLPRDTYLSVQSLLKPAYGWGNLQITRDGMLSLLSALDVSPSIYRYLTAFGRKSSPIDEGFAGLDLDVTLEPSGGLASLGKSPYSINTDI